MNDCPFCALAADEENALIALRTPSVIVVPALKQRQLNRGHMLVLPSTHVTRTIDVEPLLSAEIYKVAGRVSMAVSSSLRRYSRYAFPKRRRSKPGTATPPHPRRSTQSWKRFQTPRSDDRRVEPRGASAPGARLTACSHHLSETRCLPRGLGSPNKPPQGWRKLLPPGRKGVATGEQVVSYRRS